MKKLFSILSVFILVAFLAVGCDDDTDIEVEDTDINIEDTTASILGTDDAETQYNVTMQGTIKTLSEALNPDTTATAQTGEEDLPEVGEENQMFVFESQGKIFLVFNADGTYARDKLMDKKGQSMTLTGDIKTSKGLNMFVTNFSTQEQQPM